MTDVVLSVSDMSVGYGGVAVVHHVSIELRRGSAIALLGANGAGKSTLLRGVSGLINPSAGRVTLDGADVTGASAEKLVRLGLSHVAEGRRIFKRQTVLQNLEIGMYPLRPSKALFDQRRQEMYAHFPILEKKANDPAGSLSGGQQQMLAIAQALVRKPTVLMLDEPSLGLAPILVEEVFQTLEKVRATGQSIVLVEQIIERTLEFVDYAYVLQNGRVAAEGSPAELAKSDVVRRAYLGEALERAPLTSAH
jgi:branched-chain amino acid transport system ATP-binding protein